MTAVKRKVAVAGAAVALTGGTVAVAQQCDAPPEPVPATVTTAAGLNDWMNSHTVTDLDGRTITINDGPVKPPAGTTLRNGTLRRTVDRQQVTWHHVTVAADEVTIENLSVIGNESHDPKFGLLPIYDPLRESQHGIAVIGADNVTLSDVTIAHVHGDGLYIDGGSVDTRATGLDIQQAGRTLITSVFSTRTRIDDVYAFGAGLWVVNLEASGKSQKVVDFQATNLRTFLTGGRHPSWLWVDGPDFNCQVGARVQRPTGLSSGKATIDPCTTPGVTVT